VCVFQIPLNQVNQWKSYVHKVLQLFVVSHTTIPLYKLFKIIKLLAVYLGCVYPNFNYRRF
jgi:hypothetical protein